MFSLPNELFDPIQSFWDDLTEGDQETTIFLIIQIAENSQYQQPLLLSVGWFGSLANKIVSILKLLKTSRIIA